MSEEFSFERIACDNIEATAATQVRLRIDKKMVDQYTEDFQNGAKFPPLTCFREENSERIILADGFHRLRAAINAGREDIGCNIYVGGMREALMEALGSNAEHGSSIRMISGSMASVRAMQRRCWRPTGIR